MMTSYPFKGKIPVGPNAITDTAPYAKTDWPEDSPTVPCYTFGAWARTAWPEDTDNGAKNVYMLKVCDL